MSIPRLVSIFNGRQKAAAKADRLENQGVKHREQYQRTGVVIELNAAIQCFQEAINAAPHDHDNMGTRLENLGTAYRIRYRRSGDVSDLNSAIESLQQAVDGTSKHHPDRARRVECLASAYGERYQGTGVLTDLDVAIERQQEALNVPFQRGAERINRLQSLACSYQDRYLRTRALSDLNAAIQKFQEAADTAPKHHPGWSSISESLGLVYQERYERGGEISDLDTAMKYLQNSVDISLVDNTDPARQNHNRGLFHRERYRREKAPTDLDMAIQELHKAVNATLGDNFALADRLESLGMIYQDLYMRSGVLAELEVATKQFQEALEATPKDHPYIAGRLHRLGRGYEEQYRLTGTPEYLEKAVQLYQKAVEHSPSPILDRLRPAIQLLKLHAKTRKWTIAHDVAVTAMSLVPLLALRYLENTDKQQLIVEIAGLASDAAAIAIMARVSAYEALSLLELGRNIILGSLNDLRADVSSLQFEYPQIAEEYLRARNELDTAVPRMDQNIISGPIPDSSRFRRLLSRSPGPQVSQTGSDRRYKAEKDMELMIKAIRQLPSFERFLLAPAEHELKAAATSGPIVILNASKYRCDAFTIEEREIRVLELPSLHYSEVQNRALALNVTSVDQQVLEWLWDTIAAPVLSALGFTEVPLDMWPRIWWIPTGALTRLPIHAAGYHDHGLNSVLDRVISSYSSSVRQLVQTRMNASNSRATSRPEKVVLVGTAELQHAPREVDQLIEICDQMKLEVCRPQTTQKDVLTAVKDCEIFHFAGHGFTDSIDPSKSALLLSGERLTVSSLFEINLQRRQPFLAYLSACGTGQIKHDTLIDEGLHLIAAYQLAGFRHVIGTLWEVNDSSCVEVAVDTHKLIQERGMSNQSVSEGLHLACKRLRQVWVLENSAQAVADDCTMVHAGSRTVQEDKNSTRGRRDVTVYDETPLYWVPYVHFGT